jgi:hypothetical protein
LQTSSPPDLWETLADEAAGESRLWGDALRAAHERELEPVFSALGDARYALGIESIYEGYLLHYGRPRLFAPRDADVSLLLGDYLYAHGLERIARLDDVRVVSDLAQLISLCAQLRADAAGDDGPLWAATAALLGREALEPARSALRLDLDAGPLRALAVGAAGAEPVARALASHRARLR